MNQYLSVIQSMISISDDEFFEISKKLTIKTFKKNEVITNSNYTPDEIYFINKGLIRLYALDNKGNEHTMHFSLENQFAVDYANFLLNQNSTNILQAIEETEVLALTRKDLEWCYKNLKDGEKLGRLIAEYYFIHHTDRIKNLIVKTPKERYDLMTSIFPKIHTRVPQHMIASYLGVSPVHLSRIKKLQLT